MAEVELQQIGPYNVTELLGVSSTSNFYRGKQRKKEIVIKKLNIPLATAASKEAFLARAMKLKKLKNRYIVNILDANFVGDSGYLVMEYTAGETLRQCLTPGEQMASDQVKRILSPVASALHYAHMNNVLHGNLHPGSLLLGEQHGGRAGHSGEQHNGRTGREGRNGRDTSGPYPHLEDSLPLLAEFSLTPPGSTTCLDDEAFAIPYMAPEHLNGQLNAASDQYSLAVIVYELLCGRRPYEATERELLREQQRQAPLPLPGTLNTTISPAVERVIVQALAFDPAERFPHTQAFADHYLSALIGFPVKTPAPRILATPKPSNTPSNPTQHDTPSIIMQSQPTPPTIVIREPSTESSQIQITPSTPITSNGDKSPDTIARTSSAKSPQIQTAPSTPITSNGDLLPDGVGARCIAPVSTPMPVSPPLTSTRELLTDDASLHAIVVADLCQGGILSQSLPGYEERPSQVAMASTVARSITQSLPAIIEAGTGTGKSLAYLLPIVRSGEVAIISTANKALQEQLFYKDIPFVQKHIKRFEAALVKGVNNYVCLDRVDTERVGMQVFTKNRSFERLLDIVTDEEATFNGDFETLGFQLPGDIRARIATDSDQCAWSKCNFFSECYVRRMRERADRAQVIVVNHTLLLLDAAMDGYLLPERDLIVLDEAHHLEEEATRSFTVTINPNQIQTLLAQRLLKDHTLLTLQDETMRAAQDMWMRLEQTANPGYKGRVNLVAPLEEGLRLATVIADLADSLRKQRPRDMEEKDGQLYDKLLKRTQNLAENVRMVFSVAEPTRFVYYVERVEGSVTRGFVLQASAAPLDVTSWLKERLFGKSNVICTSATLATIGPNTAQPQNKGPNFSYFRRRVGLDPAERSDVLEHILPLAFDYESNALLYLPRHLPEPTFGPGADDYMKDIAREMYRLVKASRGRAFLLFSSKRMLDRAFELMAPHLPYPLLKQGDMTRLELTQRFRQEEGAVLFGLKSFWEGVDIAGDALSLVVIDKLPFDPPDDPVHEARVAQMKAAGENWFGTYVLPQAVLRLKQGLGRLLRTREDRGVMAILDTRLHTKGYGKQVINALPPARRASSIKEVEQFFTL